MVRTVILVMLVLVSFSVAAQVQTQIIGDSVRIKSNTGTGELILENSTKNVNGFLFNKGQGRTEFRRGMIKVYDSVYIIGGDTLNLSLYVPPNAWKLNGNAGTNPGVNFLGTTDNKGLVFKTNNQQRVSVFADGTFNIAGSDTASLPRFRVYPNGDFSVNATNTLPNVFGPTTNGIRFISKFGLLEIGTSNNVDTNISTTCCGSYLKSAIVINSDFTNTFKGHVHGSLVTGDGMTIDTAGGVIWSILSGEHHYANGTILKSAVSGWGMNINNGGYIGYSGVSGQSHQFFKPVNTSSISGFANVVTDSTAFSMVGGYNNSYGGVGQLVAGRFNINRTPYGSILGNSAVDFSSLPYLGYRANTSMLNLDSIQKYPLFALGNSHYLSDAAHRSNAMTVLYNGRTQINTTGFDNNLTETNVTPKAALEVVSTNSGVLLPRLTTAQRNSIAAGDLQNSLLLYNTDSSKFQFYDGSGSTWRTIGGSGSGSSSLNFTVQSLSESGSNVAWDVANGMNGDIQLTGTGRTVSITNPVPGQTYRLKIRQDATGNRTITTWPTGTLWPSGNPPTLSTSPQAVDMVTLYYDGTSFYGDSRFLYLATSNVSILYYNAQNAFSETDHIMTNVPPGALLVLTTTNVVNNGNANVTSSPALTWTKRADATGTSSGSSEIYTAVFTAGGTISINSDWSDNYTSSVCYVVMNQEPTLGGASQTGSLQSAPSVPISSTRANSILFCATSAWNAVTGTKTYRGTPNETDYNWVASEGIAFHYWYPAPTTGSYTVGLTSPTGQGAGTAVLEIRSKP